MSPADMSASRSSQESQDPPRPVIPGVDTSAIPDDLARLIAANQQLAAAQTATGQLVGGNDLIGLPTGGGGEVLGLPSSPTSQDLPASPDFRGTVRRASFPPVVRSVAGYLGLAAVLGLISAGVWHLVVTLPQYVVGSDHVATMTEREIALVAGTDAWYSLIGAIAGLVLGVLAWIWFHRLGWPSAVIAVAGSGIAAGVAWLGGEALGPRNFAERMASAAPGDRLPIDFELHMHSAVLVWLAAAILPVLLNSSLRNDAEHEFEPAAAQADAEQLRRWQPARGLGFLRAGRKDAARAGASESASHWDAESSAREVDDTGPRDGH